MKAVNKILIPKNIDFPTEKVQENLPTEKEFIFFKADKKIYKFYYHEILFFEGYGNYVKVHTQHENPLLILDKLGDLEQKLPETQFIRTHKSFLVNLSHIKQIEGNRIKIGQNDVPISQSHREMVLEKVKI